MRLMDWSQHRTTCEVGAYAEVSFHLLQVVDESSTFSHQAARPSQAPRNGQAGMPVLHGREFVFFRLRQLVDLRDVGVSEFLYLFQTITLVVF